jgi:hypothetical protein
LPPIFSRVSVEIACIGLARQFFEPRQFLARIGQGSEHPANRPHRHPDFGRDCARGQPFGIPATETRARFSIVSGWMPVMAATSSTRNPQAPIPGAPYIHL